MCGPNRSILSFNPSWPSVFATVCLRIFTRPRLSLATFTDLRACVVRGSVVSEGRSVAYCVRGERRGGCPVVWLYSQGQNQHFISHLFAGRLWREGRRTRVAIQASPPGTGQIAPPARAAPSLSMGRVGKPPFLSSSSVSPGFFAQTCPRLLQRTLAAAIFFSSDLHSGRPPQPATRGELIFA
jgi:hypothetical protein